MRLASGAARSPACSDEGLNVGLGTDGAASNNRLDLFREMQQASLLAKLSTGGRRRPCRHRALRTSHPRRRPRPRPRPRDRLDFATGKAADLCAVTHRRPDALPCFHPSPTSFTC